MGLFVAARCQAALAAPLHAVATECQAHAAGFSDAQAFDGLTITEGLRAIFQRPAAASPAVAGPEAQSPERLTPDLLTDVLTIIL